MKNQKIITALLATAMLGTSSAAHSFDFFHKQKEYPKLQGKVIGVMDGDTINLLDNEKKQHRIRLAEIDAPEIGHGAKRPGQPFGDNSKRNLSNLCYGKQAEVEVRDTDRYNRIIGVVYCDGINVNLQQAKDGMAWAYTQYSKDPAYKKAEDAAKGQKKGLWSDPHASPPWNWRHGDGWEAKIETELKFG